MSATDRKLLGHDDLSGMTEWYHYDPHTGGFAVETVQDVEPLLDHNRRQWNATEKSTRYGEMTKVASIPNVVIMELAKQGILSMTGSILDDRKYRRWLNDPDNLKWRTRAGTV